MKTAGEALAMIALVLVVLYFLGNVDCSIDDTRRGTTISITLLHHNRS